MDLQLALRDEKVNIYAMTKGNPYGTKPYQIILCKKEPRHINKPSPFLFDSKKSDPVYKLSAEGKQLLNKISNYNFELRYLANIDCQLKVAIKPGLFEMLKSEGFFSIWEAEAPYKYFEGAEVGYLFVFRVFQLSHSIDESLLDRGRSGRNWYYNLNKLVDVDLLKPIVADAEFIQLKDGLTHLLNQCGYLLGIINSEYEGQLTFKDETLEDNDLVEVISRATIDNSPPQMYIPTPQEKKALTEGHDGNSIYPRDQMIAVNALKRSGYKCEIEENHQTFMRKKDCKPYTEPHHLIPLSKHADFIHDLDVEANIVSLCSHCHNLVHYGMDYKKIIRRLYEQRKDQLAQAGISISFEKLIEYYE